MTVAISACVICKNEVQRIGKTLDSLSWCAEVVVVDSGSTDGTVELVKGHRCGAKVVHQEWLGYNRQREFAAGLCQQEWVLMLDADEECDERLIAEVRGLTEERAEGVGIFRMARKNFLGGRHVRCWGPDFQTRLIHKGRVEWVGAGIPEIRKVKAGFREERIGGCLLHNREGEFRMKDLLDGPRVEDDARVLSGFMWERGKRATWTQLFWRPVMTFLKYYVLKGSFLDGRFGLVIAYKTTIGVMLKYSVLYAKEEWEGE